MLTTPAHAEAKKAATVHVRGSIVNFAGYTLKVKTCQGETVDVALVDGWKLASVKATARFVGLHRADELGKTLDGSGRYYESIDLIDAVHPQTIPAYQMNGEDLSVGHGAPLRLRVERQLGCKLAKHSCGSNCR